MHLIQLKQDLTMNNASISTKGYTNDELSRRSDVREAHANCPWTAVNVVPLLTGFPTEIDHCQPSDSSTQGALHTWETLMQLDA